MRAAATALVLIRTALKLHHVQESRDGRHAVADLGYGSDIQDPLSRTPVVIAGLHQGKVVEVIRRPDHLIHGSEAGEEDLRP